MSKMKRVIVIDDDTDIRESFSNLLSLENYEVLATGKDGKEAVDLYHKFKPDLIFLDYNMPNFDGMYAVEGIKKIDPHAKIVMITGCAECCKNIVDYCKKTFNHCNCSFFKKPCDIEQILCKII